MLEDDKLRGNTKPLHIVRLNLKKQTDMKTGGYGVRTPTNPRTTMS
jgi:hypothetical protein